MCIPQNKISTLNSIVADSIRTGEPLGYTQSNASRPKTDLEKRYDELNQALLEKEEENVILRARVAELENKLNQSELASSAHSFHPPLSHRSAHDATPRIDELRASKKFKNLNSARLTDAVLQEVRPISEGVAADESQKEASHGDTIPPTLAPTATHPPSKDALRERLMVRKASRIMTLKETQDDDDSGELSPH